MSIAHGCGVRSNIDVMRNALALALAMAAGLSFADSQQRVSYDAHSFKIDGKNTYIYSGAFHYFRCPKELWPARLKAIKDAGFNAIETYAAWNVHEPLPPSDLNDFSHVDVKDLDDFLTMAIDRFKLNVIIRPGPYICSEWDMGGYPSWLIAKKPEHPLRSPWLRSDDPAFLDWARHWYKAVDPVIAKHQITRQKPGSKGVILYQIENEYDYAAGSDEVHLNQLHALAVQAKADGIDVPLISCWTHQIRSTTDPVLKDVVDCPNFYPRWGVSGTLGSIKAARDEQPGKPVMITELQGGWFSEVGGLLAEDQSGITAAQERNLTLFCMQNGVTGTNYYMLFGGTNFGDRTPPNITTSYDYFAPIREDGSGGAKYNEVKALGDFVSKYGSDLAVSSPEDVAIQSDQKDVEIAVRKSPDGTQFVFLRNASVSKPFSGTASVAGDSFQYNLTPFGSFVIVVKPGQKIQSGEWLPKASQANVDKVRPHDIRIAEALSRTDDGSTSTTPATPGDVVKNGVYDNRYVVYRSSLGTVAPNTKLWLQTGGSAVIRIDGEIISPTGKRHGQPLFNIPVKASGHPIEVLYENPGRPNGGDGMEEEHGLISSKLIANGLSDKLLTNWKLHKSSFDAAFKLVGPEIDETGWDSVEVRSGDRQDQLDGYGSVAVFRTTIDIAQADIDSGLTHIDFDGIDDEGWVFVNGTKIGENHEWNQPVRADIKAQLHAGKNVIAVVVRNFGGQGGLYGVPILSGGTDDGPGLSWTIAELKGVLGHWDTDMTASGWDKVALDVSRPVEKKIVSGTAKASASDKPTSSLATWFKLSFDKPNSKRTVALRINALGNGLLWLNGHPLGRFWQVGPQREYYLPECWLKPQGNDLRVLLRPVDGYATIRAAQIGAWGE